MQSFTFHCPTEVVFGRGAENAVAEKLRAFGASRVLILYGGGSAERTGLLSRIEKNLTSAAAASSTRQRRSRTASQTPVRTSGTSGRARKS